jgi:anti-sigma-K factor RskA
MKKTLIATTLVAAAAAAGSTVLVAGPASADVERRDTCAGATYEVNVDRERGGFEVDADIDNARAGSEWRVAIRHDGTLATSRVLRADDEGELDLDTFRKNTRGKDTFRLTVTPAGGSSCSVTVTLR